MTNLLDHIKTAVEIAEKADTFVTMYPNQVRYLLDMINGHEKELDRLESENAALRARVEELEAEIARLKEDRTTRPGYQSITYSGEGTA